MPLSDHEQRLLDQMERALYAEDPKFADALRKTRRPTVDRKRIVLGIVGILAGLGVLVGGVATSIPLVGLLGFLGMLAGAFFAYTAFVAKPAKPTSTEPRTGSGKSRSAKAAAPGGFMDRLEDRWRRRREQRGGGQF